MLLRTFVSTEEHMSHPQVSWIDQQTFRDTGDLSPYLAEVAGMLQQRHYVATSIQRYLREAAAFSCWFAKQRQSLHEFNEQQLERYLRLHVPVVRRRQVIRRGVH